tara:strand:- start:4021 stop:4398 length:378 start_codon:yes stop_codon:yes gene_type:complete
VNKPFAWGATDCITFANDAVRAQRGVGFVDDLLARQYSSELGAMRVWKMAQVMTGRSDIVDVIDDRLVRSSSRHPIMGSVVARRLDQKMVFSHAIGIMGSRGGVYMTVAGFERFDLSDGDLAWEI